MESGSVPEVPGDDQHDRKVFREPRQVLGGFMGQGKGQTSPVRGCAPPHLFPREQGVWGAPSRVPTSWLGGQVTQRGDPICPGRRPLLRLDLRGPAPLSLAPIYMWGLGGKPHPSSGAALLLSQVLLLSRGAWRSPEGLPCSSITTTPLCCCWMESSSTSPSLLAGSRHGRCHRAIRVLNAEVSSVRH